MSRAKELDKSKYHFRQIFEAETIPKVAYEVHNRSIDIVTIDDEEVTRISGTIPQMRRFAKELLEVCDTWGGIRT